MCQKDNSILEEAIVVTGNDRNYDYGSPLKNHGMTARLCSEYLSSKYKKSITITAEDFCILMILSKISRQAHQDKRDNLVDIAGYARNIELIQKALKEVDPFDE